MGATLTYGFLALFILPMLSQRRRRALWCCWVLCLLIGGVGFSRIALTAHYLSDVLGAIVIGSTWVWFSQFAVHRLAPNRGGEVLVERVEEPASASIIPVDFLTAQST